MKKSFESQQAVDWSKIARHGLLPNQSLDRTLRVGQLGVRCVGISNQLLDNLNVQKRLHGDRWLEVMADLGTALQLHMKTTGETNAISAALPIAKKMSEAGENPMIFVAVATELANTEVTDPYRERVTQRKETPNERTT